MISPSLARVLRRDRTLHAAVTLNLETFERWLGGSKTPFFPEYTDHGPAALVLAIILHDLRHAPERGRRLPRDRGPWPPRATSSSIRSTRRAG